MATTLRIFDVATPTKVDPRPPARQRPQLSSVEGKDDEAKRNAKLYLEKSGVTVRSLNWAPGPNGNELIAYVSPKKGAA